MEQQEEKKPQEVNLNKVWHDIVLTENERQKKSAVGGLVLMAAMQLNGLSGCMPTESSEQKAEREAKNTLHVENVKKKTEEIKVLHPNMSTEQIETAASQAVERWERRLGYLQRGEERLANKEYVGAANDFNSAEATNKEQNAYLEAAKVSVEKGYFRDAVEYVGRSKQDNSETKEIYLKVADYQANEERNYNVAAEYYKKAGATEKMNDAYQNGAKYAESIHDTNLAMLFYQKIGGDVQKEKAHQFAEESVAKGNNEDAVYYYGLAGDTENVAKMNKEIVTQKAKRAESDGSFAYAAKVYGQAGMEAEAKEMLVHEAKRAESDGYFAYAAKAFSQAGMEAEAKEMLVHEAKRAESDCHYGYAFQIYHAAGTKDKEAEMVAIMEHNQNISVGTVVKVEPTEWDVTIGPDDDATDAHMLKHTGVGAVAGVAAAAFFLGPFAIPLGASFGGTAGLATGAATAGNPEKQLEKPEHHKGFIITFETGQQVRTNTSYEVNSRVPIHYLD